MQAVSFEVRPPQAQAFGDPKAIVEQKQEEEAPLVVVYDGHELLEFLLGIDVVFVRLRGERLRSDDAHGIEVRVDLLMRAK